MEIIVMFGNVRFETSEDNWQDALFAMIGNDELPFLLTRYHLDMT